MRRYPLLLVFLTLSLLSALAPVQAVGPSVPPSDLAATPQGPLPDPSTAAGVAAIPAQARAKIDPHLLEQLIQQTQDAQRQGGKPAPVTYLVHLREQAPLRDLAGIHSQGKRRALLVERLQETARRSQSGMLTHLVAQRRAGEIVRYRSFWVFNGLAVEGNLASAIALAQRPEVEAIRPNRIHHLSLPESPANQASVTAEKVEWNIARIGADRVWQTLGFDGAGIVVANMDSGVDWTHPSLQSRYRGYDPANPAASHHDYNWFDPTGTYPNAPGPNQPKISSISDHGTHTMGTMVGGGEGGTTIGVAPGARWIAAKVFDDQGNSTDEWIHAGFQWLLAPTDLRGQNPDPSKAPDIVCNSWGDNNGEDLAFRDDVNALRAAGIFTAWAAGNKGPGEGTIGSPASLENACAVGAVDARDTIAYFSSRGPSPWGYIKPDVVAPGVNIRSTIAGGGYETGWSGTSMATPHVAGLAALMWQADRSPALMGQSANPSLTITSTEHIIHETALDLGAAGKDNTYGFGLIDAYQAVSTVIQGGTFAGRVSDADTGLGLADVLLTMTSRTTGGQTSTQSDAHGYYSFGVAAGRYDVTACKFGYLEERVEDIQVTSRKTTQLDLELQPVRNGVLTGRVMRAADGLPGAATVQVLDTPISTDVDAQGYYTLTLPVGAYTVRALPQEPGYRGEQVVDVNILPGAQVDLNFSLENAPRLLIVDADAWQEASYLAQYQAMLDNLCYGYGVWSVLEPLTGGPSAALLAQYDLVIWSQPVTSPGYIEAWGVLGGYLEQGGRLLLTGQDIGYWDYELGCAPTEYARYLHTQYQGDDGGLNALIGQQGSGLEGLKLLYNTPDSAQNQLLPDAIVPGDGLAFGVLASSSGTGAGIAVDACHYRAVYLGFGLEGVGPVAARDELLARLIVWLDGERPAQAPTLTAAVSSQLAPIGSTASYAVWVTNQGQTPDSYTLTVDSSLWSARLVDPRTGDAVERLGPLAPCTFVKLELQIDIPPTAVADEAAHTVVKAMSDASGVVATWTGRTGAMPGWQKAPPLPDARYRLTVAALDGAAPSCALLAVGGYGEGSPDAALDLVTRFDLATGRWSPAARKPTAVANAALAVADGLVYVFGGYDPAAATPFLDVCEVYDPANDRWKSVTPLPVPLSGAAAAAHAGDIYLFGGSGPESESDATYRYNPQAGTWEARAPLPGGAVSFAQAVSLGEYIYLAGGWPDLAGLWRYHPATDSWEMLAPMHVGRQSFAMTAQGNHLYVAGGGSEWMGLSSAERYDLATDSWELLPPLGNADRAGAAGAWLDGCFYVVGGAGELVTAAVEVLPLAVPLGGSRLEVDRPVARVGDTLRYSLLVRNPAPTDTAASWSVALPPQVAYVQDSATGGAVYDRKSGTLQWTGSIPGAGLLPFGFSATILEEVADRTVITATALLDGGGCAPAALSAVTQAFVPSLEASTKRVDKQDVVPGERLRYTITLVNNSPFTISNVSLVDPIPEHTTYVVGSVTGGAVYNAALQCIEWNGHLPPTEEVNEPQEWLGAADEVNGQLHSGNQGLSTHEITFDVLVNNPVPPATVITNTARIDNGHGDLIERSAEVRVQRGDLSGSDMIVNPPQTTAGRKVIYTLRVRNSGPVDIAGSLRCLPPEPLNVVSTSLYASTGTVSWDDGIRWEGLVRAQRTEFVRFTATIPEDTQPQTLTTEAHLLDAGGLETVLQADLTIGTEVRTINCVPLVLR